MRLHWHGYSGMADQDTNEASLVWMTGKADQGSNAAALVSMTGEGD